MDTVLTVIRIISFYKVYSTRALQALQVASIVVTSGRLPFALSSGSHREVCASGSLLPLAAKIRLRGNQISRALVLLLRLVGFLHAFAIISSE